MPLFDYSCPICGYKVELFTFNGVEFADCPNCCGEARKQFSFGQSAPFQEDAAWISSVREVVSKDGDCAVDREFLKNPTRKNYREWMKFHKLIPVENVRGGPPTRQVPKADREKIVKYCVEKKRERERVEVR